jgi:hypothetical protein
LIQSISTPETTHRPDSFTTRYVLPPVIGQPPDVVDPENKCRESRALVKDLGCPRFERGGRDWSDDRTMVSEPMEEFGCGVLALFQAQKEGARRFAPAGHVELELVAKDRFPNVVLGSGERFSLLGGRASAEEKENE